MAGRRKSKYDQGYEAGYADGRDECPRGPSASQFSKMEAALATAEARCSLAETRAAAPLFTALLLSGKNLWELPVITWHVDGHVASAVTSFGKPTAVVHPNGLIEVNGYACPTWKLAAIKILNQREYVVLRPSDRVLSHLGRHASLGEYVVARKEADEAYQRAEDALYADAPDE
jgi:hypothetical protein